MDSRIDFYETYFKNLSPTTFVIKQEGGKIIISGFDKKMKKNFKTTDIKQYPVSQEEFNNGGEIKSSKNEDGNWAGTYRGATFQLFHITNDLSKAKYWYYSYKLYSPIMLTEQIFFSDSNDDLEPQATKKQTLKELKRSIDNQIEGFESFQKIPKGDTLKKGGEISSYFKGDLSFLNY